MTRAILTKIYIKIHWEGKAFSKIKNWAVKMAQLLKATHGGGTYC